MVPILTRYRTFETGKNLEKKQADPLDVPRRRLPIIGNVRYRIYCATLGIIN
jgi:hypothetical protein